LHRAGEFAEAAVIYETLLLAKTADADLLWLLSIAQLRLGKTEQAITNWRKSLSLETNIPLKLRTITNFLMTAQQTLEIDAPASDFFDGLDIPEWPRDLPLDRDSRSMVGGLAGCLIGFDRKEAAMRFLDGALAQNSGDPDFLMAVAPAMVDAGEALKMLELLRPLTSGAHHNNGALLIVHAAVATAAREGVEAMKMSLRARQAVPVFLSDEMPNQRLLIGVLNRAPEVIKDVYAPGDFHFRENTPGALRQKMNDEFRFLSIFPQEDKAREAMAALPQPQLIINNWVNPELLSKDDTLEFIADYADSLGLPVINHPRRACLTTRQRNAERLAGIPDLLVPKILRVLNEPRTRQEAVRLISQELGFPVIVRHPFTHLGTATVKIETQGDLAAHLSTTNSAQLYVIQYVDNPLPEGAYRKFRAVVIGEDLILLWAHFGREWSVHRTPDLRAYARLMEFDTKGKALAFALNVLRRPEETLGKPAMSALHEIGARTPLDFFGIDFDLLPDGRILFFETNAAMNFGLREREDLPEIIVAAKSAFRRLFENSAISRPSHSGRSTSSVKG
jgi:hypothetical protein